MVTVPAVAMSAAVMLARTCMELYWRVDRGLPFQRSWTPFWKPSPSAMSVKAGPPAVAELGVSAVMIGSGRVVIGNLTMLEKMPPGLRTWTVPSPAYWMALAGIAAVSRVALTNVVDRSTPLKMTVAPDTKPVPSTVSVKAGPLAAVLLGVSVVMAGAGPTVKVLVLEMLRFGVRTVIPTEVGLVTSSAGIAAVNRVVLTKVVGLASPFQKIVLPGR